MSITVAYPVGVYNPSVKLNGLNGDTTYSVECGYSYPFYVTGSGFAPGISLTVYLYDESTGVTRTQTVTTSSSGDFSAAWNITIGCHFLDAGYTLVFQGEVIWDNIDFYTYKLTLNVS